MYQIADKSEPYNIQINKCIFKRFNAKAFKL